MAYITDRNQARAAIDRTIEHGVSMALFCTASFWNTEAIILAADRFAKKHGIKNIPVVVAMTSHYVNMPQTARVSRTEDHKTGFLALANYAKLLTEGEDAPYKNVTVLMHLDHGDPDTDTWEFEEGIKYLASVMFDGQKYSYEENLARTKAYVEKHGHEVLIEGAVEGLAVGAKGKKARQNDDYVEKAVNFVKETGVDFLVADLGTEQQSTGTAAHYLKDRAQALTAGIGAPMLCLHGVSSLKDEDIQGFSEDGVVRVNMWTRIVRESGQYAAKRLAERMDKIAENDFESCEARQYIWDNIDEAARIMEGVLESLKYANLAE